MGVLRSSGGNHGGGILAVRWQVSKPIEDLRKYIDQYLGGSFSNRQTVEAIELIEAVLIDLDARVSAMSRVKAKEAWGPDLSDDDMIWREL